MIELKAVDMITKQPKKVILTANYDNQLLIVISDKMKDKTAIVEQAVKVEIKALENFLTEAANAVKTHKLMCEYLGVKP